MFLLALIFVALAFVFVAVPLAWRTLLLWHAWRRVERALALARTRHAMYRPTFSIAPGVARMRAIYAMTGAISQVSGAFLEYPGSLERFSERDTNDGVPAVPLGANPVNVPLVALTGADMLEAITARFRMIGTFNAYTGALAVSPWFPYNMVNTLRMPFQSGSLAMGAMDGHLWWLTNILRSNNREYYNPLYVGQVPNAVTGYNPQANLVSAANYAPAVSVQKIFEFQLRVWPALYFDRFYDMSADQKMLRFDNTFVSPLLMSSTGRNIIPTVQLNPLFAATQDNGPFTPTGSQVTPATWTDNGSQVAFRRDGWRQPVNTALMPPLFNWAHQWFVQRQGIAQARVQIPIPTEGQLLCIVIRMFDPTLNAGIGGPVPLNSLSSLKLTYGSGLNKFDDVPKSHQDRILRQFGFLPTEGVGIWDLYIDTKSNIDAINTYNTAAPQILLDFTGAVPGAGSYVDVCMEFLTLIGN